MKRNILDYIKYISLHNLITPIIVVVLMVTLLLVLPFRAVLMPPEAASPAEIAEIVNRGGRYVHLEMDDLAYTGYDLYISQNARASYYYLLDDSQDDVRCVFLLIKTDKSVPSAEVAGNDSGSGEDDSSTRVVLPHFSGNARILKDDLQLSMFLEGFANDVGWPADGLKDICLNVLVSSYDYHSALYIALLVIIGLLLVISLIYIISNLIIYFDPTRHEACRRLVNFGLDGEDFTDIDRELAHDCIINAGNLFATYHYLIAFSKRSIFVVPLFNIVWAYKYSTWTPLRRKGRLSYTMVIVTSPKDTIRVPGCQKKNVDRILDFLDQDFARITVGYSEEIRAEIESML